MVSDGAYGDSKSGTYSIRVPELRMCLFDLLTHPTAHNRYFVDPEISGLVTPVPVIFIPSPVIRHIRQELQLKCTVCL